MALNRQRVLAAAVELADEIGIESLSMRRLAEQLEVVPMALYKHVANKEELLDGMVEVLIREIDPPLHSDTWRASVRHRVLSARAALLRHPWARSALESRTTKTPSVLAYMDSIIGMFLAGGFSVDLTHHVMHAFGSRMWGLTQEIFVDPPGQPTAAQLDPEIITHLARLYPNVVRMAVPAEHDEKSVVGAGCDDQFEFEFALDLLLDGFARLHERQWTSR